MGKGGGLAIACIFFMLICCNGVSAADLLELHVRTIIAPAGEKISSRDIFKIDSESQFEETRISLTTHLHTVCGTKAALVPMWQFSTILETAPQQVSGESSSPGAVSMVGRRAVYIPPHYESRAMKSLIAEILKSIDSKYESSKERIEIEIPHLPISLQTLTNPGDEAPPTFEIEFLTERETGRGTADLRFLFSGASVEGVLTVQISRYAPYFVLHQQAKPGDIIVSEELEQKAFPVDEYPKALFSTYTTKFEAAAHIEAGTPLHIRNARIKPMVEPGDQVRVIMRRGAVQLQLGGNVRGKALRDELVAVKLDTGIIKKCRVKAEGEVVLE